MHYINPRLTLHYSWHIGAWNEPIAPTAVGILPYFRFRSEQVGLIETSTLMMQLNANDKPHSKL